jgi:AbrB family looped-hinge helix DNA binding protein
MPNRKPHTPVRVVDEHGRVVLPKKLREKLYLVNECVEVIEITDEKGRKGLALFKIYT